MLLEPAWLLAACFESMGFLGLGSEQDGAGSFGWLFKGKDQIPNQQRENMKHIFKNKHTADSDLPTS